MLDRNMKYCVVVCLFALNLGLVMAGDEDLCECRNDDCLDGDLNEGECNLGYATGTKCCWEAEPDCACKEFCNTDERRLRTCRTDGQYGYCCKYPRRYN